MLPVVSLSMLSSDADRDHFVAGTSSRVWNPTGSNSKFLRVTIGLTEGVDHLGGEPGGGGGGGAASSSLSVSPTCWVITVNITCLYFFPAIQKFLLKIAQIC